MPLILLIKSIKWQKLVTSRVSDQGDRMSMGAALIRDGHAGFVTFSELFMKHKEKFVKIYAIT